MKNSSGLGLASREADVIWVCSEPFEREQILSAVRGAVNQRR